MHTTPSQAPAAPAWPFGQLTPQQEHQHAEQLRALRAGELRRIPTVFGGLDEVPA